MKKTILELTSISNGTLTTSCRQSAVFSKLHNSFDELDLVREAWRAFLRSPHTFSAKYPDWVSAWEAFVRFSQTNAITLARNALLIDGYTQIPVRSLTSSTLVLKPLPFERFSRQESTVLLWNDGRMTLNKKEIYAVVYLSEQGLLFASKKSVA
jgi:hypothetical protein